MVKVRVQASEKPSNCLYWFHLNTVKDRVKGTRLSDKGSIKSVAKVENWEILPLTKDSQDLLHEFSLLCARVIVDQIPAFKSFEDFV